MNLEKLEKMFKVTNEILLTYNSDNPRENDSEVIQRLNEKLWNAGYMTWIIQKDGKTCLSVRPRSAR